MSVLHRGLDAVGGAGSIAGLGQGDLAIDLARGDACEALAGDSPEADLRGVTYVHLYICHHRAPFAIRAKTTGSFVGECATALGTRSLRRGSGRADFGR